MSHVSGQVAQDVQAYYKQILASNFGPDQPSILLFSHYGEFTPARIDAILKVAEDAVLEAGAKRRIMKRVCSVIIENLQNISLHGARNDDGKRHSFAILSHSAESFSVMTGNLILSSESKDLDKKLKHLNKLDNKELRKEYVETLCNEDFSAKGGAGLGLLTIAKRSSQPIKHEIWKLDSRLSYFTIQVIIDSL